MLVRFFENRLLSLNTSWAVAADMYWQGYYGNETTAKAIKYMDGRGTIATCFIRQQNVPSSEMKQHYIVNYVSLIPRKRLGG